jgi:nucleotide-binding universal stress UspA family protein
VRGRARDGSLGERAGVGPLARYTLGSDRLLPDVRAAAREAGMGSSCRNPFRSIVVRSLEVLQACEEALALVRGYEPPDRPFVEVEPRGALPAPGPGPRLSRRFGRSIGPRFAGPSALVPRRPPAMLGTEVISMYRRVLFAVADDETLPAAVPVVAAYARRWDADVRVLHVHRIDPAAPNGASRRLVKSVIERLEAEGVRAEGEIRLVERGAKVAPVIAGAATQAEADLVAIGSHGRSDLGALFLGSVSHAVAAGLEAPVLVLRASPTPRAEPRTVLVAVDGSAASGQAVSDAAEVASAFEAEVHVLHVRLVTAAQGASIVEPEEQASAAVRLALETLEARGIRATAEIAVSQSVVPTLVATAERIGADLVVLGSRRPSELGGLLLGSTAHDVIHRLRCPVLLGRHSRAHLGGRGGPEGRPGLDRTSDRIYRSPQTPALR